MQKYYKFLFCTKKFIMKIENFSNYLKNTSIQIQETIRKDLPRLVGNRAVLLFKENFQRESFFGRAWQDVLRRIRGDKGAAGRRKILTGPTGNLGRSIQSIPQDAAALIVSDLPYASAHNDGTASAGRGHRTVIPQRQFIGSGPQLDKEIKSVITAQLDKCFKK